MMYFEFHRKDARARRYARRSLRNLAPWRLGGEMYAKPCYKPMKILLVMDPGIPVPPKGYGGIERIVYLLAKEYSQLGHEVTLLVGPGSHFEEGRVVTFGKIGFPKSKKEGIKDIFRAWKKIISLHKEFDLVHNFGRLAYLLPILNNRIKKIMSYQREISTRNIKWINKLPNKNIVFTGCSKNLISRGGVAGKWKAIYNAFEGNNYSLVEKVQEDAPLIFLGRIERVKGAHIAIEVAKASGDKLILAGNVSQLPEEIKYFKEEVEPLIDGVKIQYVGMLNDEQKNHYLGLAKAFLFPIEWEEPFGIVMVEAMACGTPVIGFNRGSVTEVIEEGVTGFKVNTKEEMIRAISKVDKINRAECRKSALNKYDISVIAKEYISLF